MTPDREIRAIIADDEANVRFYLKRQIEMLWPELVVCAEASNGQEAVQLIETERPDVAFLDIRMPGLTGLQVVEHIPKDCQIVFITAYDEFAIDAFEQAAVDYVLKPVSEARLEKTIDRLRSRLQQSEPHDTSTLLQRLSELLAPGEAARYLRWIKASRRDEILIIATDEVHYFESDEKYTSVVTAKEELYIRKPIKALEHELDPDRFWRIHRGIIVNVGYIERTHRDFQGNLLLRLRGRDQDFPVSRTYAHRFRQM